MIAEPGDGPVDTFNAEAVSGPSAAVAVKAHTPGPEPNFFGTSRMPLQCIQYGYCVIAGEEISGGVGFLDLAQMLLSLGFGRERFVSQYKLFSGHTFGRSLSGSSQ